MPFRKPAKFVDTSSINKRLGSASIVPGESGVGDVISTSNITDNALLKGDGGVKNIQDTGIIVDDSNNVSGMGTLGVGAITTSGTLAMGANNITLAGDGVATGLVDGRDINSHLDFFNGTFRESFDARVVYDSTDVRST